MLITIGALHWLDCDPIPSLPLSLVISGSAWLIITITYLLEMPMWDSYITLIIALFVNTICTMLVTVLVLDKIEEFDQITCDAVLYSTALSHTIIGLIICIVCIIWLIRMFLQSICTMIAVTTGYTIN